MAKEKSISQVGGGLNKSSAPHTVAEGQHTHMMNGNSFSESGERLVVTNEHSNILASKFKDGFRVVGFSNHVNRDTTYFLITNPETGVSEIGQIANEKSFVQAVDNEIETGCDDCDKIRNKEAVTLENTIQVEHQAYETLVEDSCNLCLGFDVDYPIFDLIIKDENLGTKLFWTPTPGNQVPRYFEVDNVNQYLTRGDSGCGNTPEETCLDCEKLRIFRLHRELKQVSATRALGGDLKKGSYEVYGAYSDQLGNAYTNYYSVSPVIPIFDESNIIHEQVDNNKETNFSIKVILEKPDDRFEFYKIVVKYFTSKDVFQFYEQGTYPISQTDIVISKSTGTSIAVTEIFQKKPFVEAVNGMTSSNDYLLMKGIKEKEPFNLQKVVSLMGLALKWKSYRAKESLYKNADSYQYLGYNRDESATFALQFQTEDGYSTNVYNLIPRPANEAELALVVGDENDDVESIIDLQGNCDTNLRNKEYQFYNTATKTGAVPLEQGGIAAVRTSRITQTISTFTEIAVPSVPSGTLRVFFDEQNPQVTLITYLEDILRRGDLPENPIGPFVNLANLQSFNEQPENQYDNCDTADEDTNCCDNPQLQEESLEIVEVQNSQVVVTYIAKEEMQSISQPQNPAVYESDGASSRIDFPFSFAYNVAPFLSGSRLLLSRSRKVNTASNGNDRITRAEELVNYSATRSLSNAQAYFHDNKGAVALADLQENNVTMTIIQGAVNTSAGAFTNKLHKTALWFKTKVLGRERFYINISGNTSCTREQIVVNEPHKQLFGADSPKIVRVSFFATQADTSPLLSQLVDLSNFEFILVDQTIITQLQNETLFISVEASIKQSLGLGPNWASKSEERDDADEFYNPQAKVGEVLVTTHISNNPCGAWAIVDRDEIPDTFTYNWDLITLKKNQKYTFECQFLMPILDDCRPVGFEYGEFGFNDSTDTYPDNQHLYDSSGLIINEGTILNTEFRERLLLNYATQLNGQIITSSQADFRCQKIRLNKFPDNKISPFMYSEKIADSSESVINPLGVTIDPQVVRDMLEVAVQNNLITLAQKNSIVSYKIYRSDSTLDRTIIASGLVYNTKTYKYKNKDINYFNYPYNTLGRDKMFPESEDTPFMFKYAQVFSPELDYYRPILPTEMSLQGFQMGSSRNVIAEVDKHAKMVVLGRRARTLATILAGLEAAAAVAVRTAMHSETYRAGVYLGVANGVDVNVPGAIFSTAAIVLDLAYSIVVEVGRFRYQWLEAFENLGTAHNFGYYVPSVGEYNYLKTLQTRGNKLRAISVGKYLSQGMLSISDNTSGEVLKLNNVDRASAAFLSLGKYPIQYNSSQSEYVNYDNNNVAPSLSSQPIGSEEGCDVQDSGEFQRNIASPYVALKDFKPNQYGALNNIRWIDTGVCVNIDETYGFTGALGGDTFISRHSKSRKTRIFRADLLNSADRTPFPYRYYGNYGEPKYYIDYKVNSDFGNESSSFPNIFYDAKTDCGANSNTFYLEPPSKFYLYYIGTSSFLCETRINTNFRNAQKEPWEQFYPQNEDYQTITQPALVDLTRRENFHINKAYQNVEKYSNAFLLPPYYNPQDEKLKSENPNTVIYSIQDSNENSITEPWTMFRPNDKGSFKSSYGELKRIKGIESNQILMMFENETLLHNAVNQFTDGATQYTKDLGDGGMFAKRPQSLRTTDLGYGGSQSHNILSCEFGHFWADAKRGQVFQYLGGNKLVEISKTNGSKPTNMDTWFKTQLPSKFQRQFPDYPHKDNPYNGVGIHWGFDSNYSRVILTKKDYIKIEPTTYNVQTNKFTLESVKGSTFTLQELIDQKRLKEVSWTITYRPEYGYWESFMDYKPNYYIAHTDYFQSGINGQEENGLWSHLLTNKSYRVFYGKKYSFVLEYPIKNKYIQRELESVKWNAHLRRYHGEFNHATIEQNPFGKVYIYNDYENSGEMRPKLNPGGTRVLSKYPKTYSNYQEVLVSLNNRNYNLNYLYNRTVNENNNIATWKWDESQVEKTLDNRAISFTSKKTLERMRGEYFLVRLYQDGNTNLDLDFRWAVETTNNE